MRPILSLLTLIENENVQVEIPYYEAGNWRTLTTPVNTGHILFVAGGAFEELYDQVYNRASEKSGADSFWKLVAQADGTMQRPFVFDFSVADLVKIFKDIPGAIWPVAVGYFEHAGITLTITEEATFLIAEKAARENRLGARALREVFGSIVKRLEFDPLATGLVRQQDGRQVLEITREMVEAPAQR